MVYQPGLGVEAAQRSRGGDRKQTLAKDGAAGAMDATFVLSFEVKCMFQYSSIRNGNGDSLHECARRRAGRADPPTWDVHYQPNPHMHRRNRV